MKPLLKDLSALQEAADDAMTLMDPASIAHRVYEVLLSAEQPDFGDIRTAILDENVGILAFCKATLQRSELNKCREDLLKGLAAFLTKFGTQVFYASYGPMSSSLLELWRTGSSLGNVEKVQLLSVVQSLFIHRKTCQRVGYGPMRVHEWLAVLVERPSSNSKTLKGQYLDTCATVMRCFHENIVEYDADKLLRIRTMALHDLDEQNRKQDQDAPIIAGAFRCFATYLSLFETEDTSVVERFFDFVVKVLRTFHSGVQTFHRYDVLRAALDAVPLVSTYYASALFVPDATGVKLLKYIETAVFSSNIDVRRSGLKAFDHCISGFCQALLRQPEDRQVGPCEDLLGHLMLLRSKAVGRRDDIKDCVHFMRFSASISGLCVSVEAFLRQRGEELSIPVENMVQLVLAYFDILFGQRPVIPLSDSVLHLSPVLNAMSLMLISLPTPPVMLVRAIQSTLVIACRVYPSQEVYDSVKKSTISSVCRALFAIASHRGLLDDALENFVSVSIEYALSTKGELEQAAGDQRLTYRLASDSESSGLFAEFSHMWSGILDPLAFRVEKWLFPWVAYNAEDTNSSLPRKVSAKALMNRIAWYLFSKSMDMLGKMDIVRKQTTDAQGSSERPTMSVPASLTLFKDSASVSSVSLSPTMVEQKYENPAVVLRCERLCKMLQLLWKLLPGWVLQPWVYECATVLFDIMAKRPECRIVPMFQLLGSVLQFHANNFSSAASTENSSRKASVSRLLDDILDFLLLLLPSLRGVLLLSCTACVLAYPPAFLSIERVLASIQTTLSIGLSHHEVAKTALDLIEVLAFTPGADLNKQAQFVLPLLQPYLEAQQDGEVDRKTKRVNGVRVTSSVRASSLGALQMRIMKIFGYFGDHARELWRAPRLNLAVLGVGDSFRSSFRVPFKVDVGDVPLSMDPLVPRIAELALSSPVRFVRASAMEFIHATVMGLIGTRHGLQQNDEYFAGAVRYLLPIMAELSADSDAIAQQIFGPLCAQLVNYIARFCSDDTTVFDSLVLSIIQLCVSSNNGSLLTVAGDCFMELCNTLIDMQNNQLSSAVGEPVWIRCVNSLMDQVAHPVVSRRYGALSVMYRVYSSLLFTRYDLFGPICVQHLHDVIYSLFSVNMSDVAAPSFISLVESFSIDVISYIFPNRKRVSLPPDVQNRIEAVCLDNLCSPYASVRRLMWKFAGAYYEINGRSFGQHVLALPVESVVTRLEPERRTDDTASCDTSMEDLEIMCDCYGRLAVLLSSGPASKDVVSLKLSSCWSHHSSTFRTTLDECLSSMANSHSEPQSSRMGCILALCNLVCESTASFSKTDYLTRFLLEAFMKPRNFGIKIVTADDRFRYIKGVRAALTRLVEVGANARAILTDEFMHDKFDVVDVLRSTELSDEEKKLFTFAFRIVRTLPGFPLVPGFITKYSKPYAEILHDDVLSATADEHQFLSNQSLHREVLRLCIDSGLPVTVMYASMLKYDVYFSCLKKVITPYVAPLCSELLRRADEFMIVGLIRQVLVDVSQSRFANRAAVVSETVARFLKEMAPAMEGLLVQIQSNNCEKDIVQFGFQVMDILALLFRCAAANDGFPSAVNSLSGLTALFEKFFCGIISSSNGSVQFHLLKIRLLQDSPVFLSVLKESVPVLRCLDEYVFGGLLLVLDYEKMSAQTVEEHLKVARPLIMSIFELKCSWLLENFLGVLSDRRHPLHADLLICVQQGFSSSTESFKIDILARAWTPCVERDGRVTDKILSNRRTLFHEVLLPLLALATDETVMDFLSTRLGLIVKFISEPLMKEKPRLSVLLKEIGFSLFHCACVRLGNARVRNELTVAFVKSGQPSFSGAVKGTELIAVMIAILGDKDGSKVIDQQSRSQIPEEECRSCFSAALSSGISTLVVTQSPTNLASKTAFVDMVLNTAWLDAVVPQHSFQFAVETNFVKLSGEISRWRMHLAQSHASAPVTGAHLSLADPSQNVNALFFDTTFSSVSQVSQSDRSLHSPQLGSLLNDTASSVVAAASLEGGAGRSGGSEESAITGKTIELDVINELPVMASLLEFLDVLAGREQMGELQSSDAFRNRVVALFIDSSLRRNVRLFLMKLMFNRPSFFAPKADILFVPVLECLVIGMKSEERTQVGLSYIERDGLLVMLRDWNATIQKVLRIHDPRVEAVVTAVARHIMWHRNLKSKLILRSDVELFIAVVSCWKPCIVWLDCALIVRMLKVGDDRENQLLRLSAFEFLSVIVRQQLMDCLIAEPAAAIAGRVFDDSASDTVDLRQSHNNFTPLAEALLLKLKSSSKAIFEPCADVIGSILQAVETNERVFRKSWPADFSSELDRFLKGLGRDRSTGAKYIACLARISQRHPSILRRHMPAAVEPYLPGAAGDVLSDCLTLLVRSARDIDSVDPVLIATLRTAASRYEPINQSRVMTFLCGLAGADAGLNAFRHGMTGLTGSLDMTANVVEQLLLEWHTKIDEFRRLFSDDARSRFYKFLVLLMQSCADCLPTRLTKDIMLCLVHACSDPADTVRQESIGYFTSQTQSDMPRSFLHMLTNIFTSQAVMAWFHVCAAVLLQHVRTGSDLVSSLFQLSFGASDPLVDIDTRTLTNDVTIADINESSLLAKASVNTGARKTAAVQLAASVAAAPAILALPSFAANNEHSVLQFESSLLADQIAEERAVPSSSSSDTPHFAPLTRFRLAVNSTQEQGNVALARMAYLKRKRQDDAAERKKFVERNSVSIVNKYRFSKLPDVSLVTRRSYLDPLMVLISADGPCARSAVVMLILGANVCADPIVADRIASAANATLLNLTSTVECRDMVDLISTLVFREPMMKSVSVEALGQAALRASCFESPLLAIETLVAMDKDSTSSHGSGESRNAKRARPLLVTATTSVSLPVYLPHLFAAAGEQDLALSLVSGYSTNDTIGDQDSVPALLRQATSALVRKDLHATIAVLEKAALLAPDVQFLRDNLWTCYRKLGDWGRTPEATVYIDTGTTASAADLPMSRLLQLLLPSKQFPLDSVRDAIDDVLQELVDTWRVVSHSDVDHRYRDRLIADSSIPADVAVAHSIVYGKRTNDTLDRTRLEKLCILWKQSFPGETTDDIELWHRLTHVRKELFSLLSREAGEEARSLREGVILTFRQAARAARLQGFQEVAEKWLSEAMDGLTLAECVNRGLATEYVELSRAHDPQGLIQFINQCVSEDGVDPAAAFSLKCSLVETMLPFQDSPLLNLSNHEQLALHFARCGEHKSACYHFAKSGNVGRYLSEFSKVDDAAMAAEWITFIECKRLLPWLSHLLVNTKFHRHILEKVVSAFPQELYMKYNIVRDSLPSSFVKSLDTFFNKPNFADLKMFVEEMHHIVKPDKFFRMAAKDFEALCNRAPSKNDAADHAELEQLEKRVVSYYRSVVGADHELATINQLFASLKSFRQAAKVGKTNILTALRDRYGDRDKPPHVPSKLAFFSKKLADLRPDKTRLLVPGLSTAADDSLVPQIRSFEPNVMIMRSMQAPIRVGIRCSDESVRRFLVKYGEDLRRDERLMQIFGLLNGLMVASSKKLATYAVVPLSVRCGLIGWVDNTKTLGSLVQSDKYQPALVTFWERWKRTGATVLYDYIVGNKRTEARDRFCADLKTINPTPTLRSSLVALCPSLQAFFIFRSSFLKSLDTFNICSYVLGIGDRHLENFLVHVHDGSVIGIDFGYAFGAATESLYVPELMPFRLTDQICYVTDPLDVHAVHAPVMVQVMEVMRANNDLILNVLDIFLKEPLVDWKGARVEEALALMQDKLSLRQPADILVDQLKKNKDFTSYMSTTGKQWRPVQQFLSSGAQSRSREGHLASVEDQVACLIDMATDPSLKAVAYMGWSPWL